jgi:AcrR family transcriptional regulator
MAGIREKARAELLSEIKRLGRKQLATTGASGLSLRQIARDLGLVSSAIYRYYPSRDELLTELIVDAYNALGEVAEQADAAAVAAQRTPRQRWITVSDSVRSWALVNPSEFALIYGSPVPGYAAPHDTVPPAKRLTTVLISILGAGHAGHPIGHHVFSETIPRALKGELKKLSADAEVGIPEAVMARGMATWVHLLGIISFELFGHLNNVISERDLFFTHQTQRMADFVGL